MSDLAGTNPWRQGLDGRLTGIKSLSERSPSGQRKKELNVPWLVFWYRKFLRMFRLEMT